MSDARPLQLVRDAIASAEKDNERMAGRKILIEKKKEEQERLLLQAEKEEEEKRIMQERLSVQAEEERRRLDRHAPHHSVYTFAFAVIALCVTHGPLTCHTAIRMHLSIKPRHKANGTHVFTCTCDSV